MVVVARAVKNGRFQPFANIVEATLNHETLIFGKAFCGQEIFEGVGFFLKAVSLRPMMLQKGTSEFSSQFR